MKKITILSLGLFSIIFLIGCTQQSINQTQPTTQLANPQSEVIKVYKNNKNGYEIQYPSFFTVHDTDSDDVGLSNSTCSLSTKLCIPGIDRINILVRDNINGTTIDQELEERANFTKCKKIKIFPLPENFNQDELLDAIRCEFDEVPKQSPGGYSYTIFKENKIYSINFSQSETIQIAYINESLHAIAKDTYDPLGDLIMRTFKFMK